MWRRTRTSPGDFSDEIRAHLEIEAESLREAGWSEAQARAAARRAFGNVTRARERFYESGRWLWWDHLRQDVRFGTRLLAKSPGFAVVALLTLALGIGAVTVVFSAVYAVLLKPLPFTRADRLVTVWQHNPSRGWERNTVSPAEIVAWRDQSRVFDELGAYSGSRCVLAGTLGAEEYPCELASSSLFSLLGAKPIRGRTFLKDEDQADGPRSAILTYGLWQARFGGDEHIVGQWIDVNGASYHVVGVMPLSFSHLYAEPSWKVPAMWISGIDLSPTNLWNNDVGVGRLRPGVDLLRASAMMDSVSVRLAAIQPATAGWQAQLFNLRTQAAGDTRTPLIVLMGAVTFVLLIACANMANLLLARGSARAGEFAARSVLGARRGRLVRQLLTESLLLSLSGGLLGVALATLGCKALAAIAPQALLASAPGLDRGPQNLLVLAFAVSTVLTTTILFGLAPALESAWSYGVAATLKESSGASLRSRGMRRVRNILVIAELMLATVLLTGGGLMVRTLVKLTEVRLGFDPSHVLTMRIPLTGERYRDAAVGAQFWERVLRTVSAVPGVEAASVSRGLPTMGWAGQYFNTAEQPNPPAGQQPSANYLVVGAQYFRVLQIPIRSGRSFDDHDTQLSQPVVIVSETLAHQYWPGENPLGKSLRVSSPNRIGPWLSVVGVAANVRTRGPDVDLTPELYVPYPQLPWLLDPNDLIVRTVGSPSDPGLVRAIVRAIDAAGTGPTVGLA